MTHSLYQLLSQLESSRTPFTLGRYRADSILVTLTLVGERIEVDVFDDGHMEISRFKGDEAVIGGADLIEQIISNNG